MAKKPAKKEEAEAPAAEGEGKGGKKKLIIMVGGGVAVLLIVGGAAAYFLGLFGGGKKEAAHGGGHGGEAGAHAPAPEPAKTTMYVDLPDMVVNLSAVDTRAAYLKVKISLEVADKGAIDKIQPILPRVLDAFQIYLRELRTSDLDGSAGLFRVKEELQKRVNVAIWPAKIEAVLFKEILVQ